MVRAVLAMLVVCAVTAEASATPTTLPGLDVTVDLPPGVTITRSDGGCQLWASGTAATYGQTGSGAFSPLGYWVPDSWFPVWGIAESRGVRELRMCRELDAGSSTMVIVVATMPQGTEIGAHLSGVIKALEAELQRVGAPLIDYSGDMDVLLRSLEEETRNFRRALDAQNARKAAASEPTARTEPSAVPERSSTRRVAEPEDRAPRSPAGYDGLRVGVDLAVLSLEGDGIQEGNRMGASLALPLRYRRSGAKAGWVYGGRMAAGLVGDLLVGAGHGALGVAMGQPRSQGALVMVVGGDRAPVGSPLATQDGGFAGLQVLLRFPLDHLSALEATATMVAGAHGRGNWLELSLVSRRFSSLSVVAGVERRSWDDGMSSLGGQLGVGF